MNVYKYSDNNIDADIWAKYLGGNQKDLIGTSVSGNASMVQAIKNDNNGIGFTSLGYVYDLKSRYENSGLRVLPIDINDNGVLDDREYFYQHMDSLVKAITDGRFTSTLTRSLYIVYKSKPMDNLVNAFLKWVLSDGQKFVLNEGFVTLPDSKIKTELNKL
jgi:phosphate transport system substrate-binding protein